MQFPYTQRLADAPLLSGASTISIAEALGSRTIHVWTIKPSPEAVGAMLLATADLRTVQNGCLAAPKLCLPVPARDPDGILSHLQWMFDARVRSSDDNIATRAEDYVDIAAGQLLSPDDGLELEELAQGLSSACGAHAAIVERLLAGAVETVLGLIDAEVCRGADEAALTRLAAGMFVCRAGLAIQIEAVLGWRQLHLRANGWYESDYGRRLPLSIGQAFRPEIDRHAFACEIAGYYDPNLPDDAIVVSDGRTVNRINKKLAKLGLGGLVDDHSAKEIYAAFGQGRLGAIPFELERLRTKSEAYQTGYRTLMQNAAGGSRAGRHADMLYAPIPAVQRLAIVCARAYHMAVLARDARTTGDLRRMLGADIPAVLRPMPGGDWNPDQFRVRQLLHAARLEFLHDGAHLPRPKKGEPVPDLLDLPLDLSPENERRGHEILTECWHWLTSQPGARFATPFGWERAAV